MRLFSVPELFIPDAYGTKDLMVNKAVYKTGAAKKWSRFMAPVCGVTGVCFMGVR